MSKPEDVMDALRDQLVADTDLIAMGVTVFLGVRTKMTEVPYLCIEPVEDIETDQIHDRQENTFRIAIIGVLKMHDKESQIVGDNEDISILNYKNKICKAISSDVTLNGQAIFTRIQNSTYDIYDFPIRLVTIHLDVIYRQGYTSRT